VVPLDSDTTLSDVLNAAWLCRLEQRDGRLIDMIGRRALDACRTLVGLEKKPNDG
jgi:hypothetical protein